MQMHPRINIPLISVIVRFGIVILSFSDRLILTAGFRALVEENVKANVINIARSAVMQEV